MNRKVSRETLVSQSFREVRKLLHIALMLSRVHPVASIQPSDMDSNYGVHYQPSSVSNGTLSLNQLKLSSICERLDHCISRYLLSHQIGSICSGTMGGLQQHRSMSNSLCLVFPRHDQGHASWHGRSKGCPRRNLSQASQGLPVHWGVPLCS